MFSFNQEPWNSKQRVSSVIQGKCSLTVANCRKLEMGEVEQQRLLCEAAATIDAQKARTLIEAGADVSYFNGDGLTPLMHAAKYGHADVVKILLDVGALWNALSHSNLCAGDFAMDVGHQDAFDSSSSGELTLDAKSVFDELTLNVMMRMISGKRYFGFGKMKLGDEVQT